MFARFILAIALLVTVVYSSRADEQHGRNTTWTDPNGKIHVYGSDGTESWYHLGDSGPQALKEALTAEKGFLGSDNIGYRMVGNRRVCAALKAVKLPCDYNTRGTLSMFLTVNGKGLFPASGGTNPYYTEFRKDDNQPDDGFIGHPPQNDMLANAIMRNAKLFHNGDLTANDVKKSWK